MHTVELQPSGKNIARQVSMTQYMLKLLTILSNILITHLLVLDAGKTDAFVAGLGQAIKETKCGETSLNAVNSLVPACPSSASNEQIAMTLGCSLLKELAFKFVTYVSEEVTPAVLKTSLLKEYIKILYSLVTAELLASKLSRASDPEQQLQLFSDFL